VVLPDRVDNSAIDVIVQVDRFADGKRRLSEVAVVASHRRETFRLASVMEFASDPVGPDRTVTGRAVHRQLPEAVLRRLFLAGVTVPPEFTGIESDAAAVERTAGE
jgi:pilus assembly protein CpaF